MWLTEEEIKITTIKRKRALIMTVDTVAAAFGILRYFRCRSIIASKIRKEKRASTNDTSTGLNQ